MLAELYMIRRGSGGWRAYMTIDWTADWMYWSGQHEPFEYVRLIPAMPLGVVEETLKGMVQYTDETVSRKQLGRMLIATAKKAYVVEGRALEHVMQVDEGAAEGRGEPALSWLEAAVRAGQCLAGRALLREEALQLMSDSLPDVPVRSSIAPVRPGVSSVRQDVSPVRQDTALAQPLFVLQLAMLQGVVQLCAALERTAPETLRCRRCGSGKEAQHIVPCAACGGYCAYCEACLMMGRGRRCELLVIGLSEGDNGVHLRSISNAGNTTKDGEVKVLMNRWKLSPAQADAAAVALAHIRNPLRKDDRFLLWAVTGAGKTEMVFPLLEAVLSSGGRVLLAAPRRDVVLELAPRLRTAFPDRPPIVLYGGSEARWESGALTLATTHQLLRFQEAFDLVILDELDAFPYHNNPLLMFAADKCRKKHGAVILLSATPPPALQKAAARGKLPSARVPARYHRHPLPEPRRLRVPALDRVAAKSHLPSKLLDKLRLSIARGAQAFLFVPYIRHVPPLVSLLRRKADAIGLVAAAIDGTSSEDAGRGAKVTAFRERTLRVLVTTTILERGVTIPRSDVFVLEAGHELFDAAALVQMAGRAGRSADDPAGSVYFAGPNWTRSQQRACREIRSMNRLARKKGYISK